MALNLYVYEDSTYRDFFPITVLRPVYSLRAGIRSIFEKIQASIPHDFFGLTSREQIAAIIGSETKECPVNMIKKGEGDVLFVNGRVADPGDLLQHLDDTSLSTVYKDRDGENTVAVLFKSTTLGSIPNIVSPEEYSKLYEAETNNMGVCKTSATLYNYCWDIMADIDRCIRDDFASLVDSGQSHKDAKIHNNVSLINEDDIYLGYGVKVYPCSVLDASSGPIYIGDNVQIDSHAAIYGPCYIGPNSLVVAGKISSSSIGHTCRVGGEIEESVFHAYVNKYHAGFIGHSYVGSWVNFGAMTTNSDLKNNYSNIRVTLNGNSIDSGSIKVGSFIGDHTKTGIGTLLNTGINIGISCNLFGGTLIADKEVPSFSWGNTGNYQRYEFTKAMATILKSCERRGVEIQVHEEEILQAVFNDKLSDKGIINFA